jgi:hypothetical protein
VQAAKAYGCRSIGIEYDAELCQRAGRFAMEEAGRLLAIPCRGRSAE